MFAAQSILPIDILEKEIPKHLDETIINYAETCKFLFFSLRSQYQPFAAKLHLLLKHTVKREQQKAGEILLKYPGLLMIERGVTDGFLDSTKQPRKFKSISVLKYAAWSFDTPMLYWLLLYWSLSFLSDQNNTKKNSLEWIKSIHDQIKNISRRTREKSCNNYINYELSDLKAKLDEVLAYVPVEEKLAVYQHLVELKTHYDISTLINPLEAIQGFTISKENFYASWGTVIRDAQRQTTQQVVDEYCRTDRPFGTSSPCFDTDGKFNLIKIDTYEYYVGSFKKDYLPRSDHIFAPTSNNDWYWSEMIKMEDTKGLAILRGCSDKAIFVNSYTATHWLTGDAKLLSRYDLRALRELDKTRKQEYQELMEQLRPTLALEPPRPL